MCPPPCVSPLQVVQVCGRTSLRCPWTRSLTPCTDRRWASPTWPLTSACEERPTLHPPHPPLILHTLLRLLNSMVTVWERDYRTRLFPQIATCLKSPHYQKSRPRGMIKMIADSLQMLLNVSISRSTKPLSAPYSTLGSHCWYVFTLSKAVYTQYLCNWVKVYMLSLCVQIEYVYLLSICVNTE